MMNDNPPKRYTCRLVDRCCRRCWFTTCKRFSDSEFDGTLRRLSSTTEYLPVGSEIFVD